MIECGCHAGMQWREGGYVTCDRGCWNGMFFQNEDEIYLWRLLFDEPKESKSISQ